eukprot:scaffold6249_cov124-Isochrysis_galbana.AAC.2
MRRRRSEVSPSAPPPSAAPSKRSTSTVTTPWFPWVDARSAGLSSPCRIPTASSAGGTNGTIALSS